MRDIVSRVYPGGFKDWMRQLLLYNGIEYDVDRLMAAITGLALGLSCTLALIIYNTHGIPFLKSFLPAAALLLVGAYTYLTLRADGRGKFVEHILPDALKLMSSNLRAGLSIDKALLIAARPEFGCFQKEIKRAAGKIISGESLENALGEMSVRIKSNSLEVTIDLIVQGVRSGGELADALDRIADILREREFVQKEIKAGVQMYISFIMFAILFGAPLLFGISSFLIEMLKNMSNALIIPGAKTLGGFTPMNMPFTVEFIKTFSVVSLVSTSVMGSIVIGLINSGNWKNGVKYIPVFCTISVALFLIINKLLVIGIGTMLS